MVGQPGGGAVEERLGRLRQERRHVEGHPAAGGHEGIDESGDELVVGAAGLDVLLEHPEGVGVARPVRGPHGPDCVAVAELERHGDHLVEPARSPMGEPHPSPGERGRIVFVWAAPSPGRWRRGERPGRGRGSGRRIRRGGRRPVRAGRTGRPGPGGRPPGRRRPGPARRGRPRCAARRPGRSCAPPGARRAAPAPATARPPRRAGRRPGRRSGGPARSRGRPGRRRTSRTTCT